MLQAILVGMGLQHKTVEILTAELGTNIFSGVNLEYFSYKTSIDNCRGIYCAKYYGQGGGGMVPWKKMKNEAVGNKMKKKEKGKRKKGKGKRRKGKGGA